MQDEMPMATYMEQHAPEIGWISPVGVERSMEQLTALPTAYDVDEASALADVGCGDGTLTSRLSERYPEATVDGVEYDTATAEATRRRFEEDDAVTIHAGDALDILPQIRQHDMVYGINIVQALPEPENLLDTVYDDVRPAGYAAITTPATGAEDVFIDPARSDPAITVHDSGSETYIETERAIVTVTDEADRHRVEVEATIEDPDIPADAVTATQYTYDPERFDAMVEATGFKVVERQQLACDPTGIPALMELFGYMEAAETARDLASAYHADAAAVEEALPTVDLYVLERPMKG